MLRQVEIKYTAYGDLKEGDEFIRVSNFPVLLRDINGKRNETTFTPSDFGMGKSRDIRRMVKMPGGWLKEIFLCDMDSTETEASVSSPD